MGSEPRVSGESGRRCLRAGDGNRTAFCLSWLVARNGSESARCTLLHEEIPPFRAHRFLCSTKPTVGRHQARSGGSNNCRNRESNRDAGSDGEGGFRSSSQPHDSDRGQSGSLDPSIGVAAFVTPRGTGWREPGIFRDAQIPVSPRGAITWAPKAEHRTGLKTLKAG
jgi:hypothetical protein